MANVVVVGAQWGDEGKGKLVDWLSEQADTVVRFQGGHNAGHTLVIGENVYKLSLLPSGVVRPDKLAVIGNGVVLDPYALAAEVEKLPGPGRRHLARQSARRRQRAADPVRCTASSMRCASRPIRGTKIGTTKRGIGPAYEDKVGRRAIRLMDLADLDTLPEKIERLLSHHNALRRGLRARRILGGGDLRGTRLDRAQACCPTWTWCGGCSTRNAGPASASCSRARRARCSTSTTAPIRS